jgi:C_GCAxxG_C_C family probable redox protein
MNAVEMRRGVDKAMHSNLYCAESVLLGVAKGLEIESPLIPRIASGFCSGLSRTGGTCGAVNGGVMALGLIFGRDNGEAPPDSSYEKVQTFLKRFEESAGSCNCLEITGCDLGTEEGYKRYLEKDMWKKCQDLTRMAVAMVAEIAEHGDQDAAD